MREIDENWGGPVALAKRAPSRMDDRRFVDWWSAYLRHSASPRACRVLTQMNHEVDVRHVLPSVHVPTLVIHREGDLVMHTEEARFIAGEVPDAKLVLLPGGDHLPWVGDQDAIIDEIEEFLTGVRRGPDPDRVLATVLFVDLVASTERATELGDRRWSEVLGRFHSLAQNVLSRFRGQLIDTAGDGFLATFDGPARAIRCAAALVSGVRSLELEARAGVHTGEVEVAGAAVRGIAVHTAARVLGIAAPGEVLVSGTAKDLVAGSGLTFEDRGRHTLKGVPGEWHLFAAGDSRATAPAV